MVSGRRIGGRDNIDGVQPRVFNRRHRLQHPWDYDGRHHSVHLWTTSHSAATVLYGLINRIINFKFAINLVESGAIHGALEIVHLALALGALELPVPENYYLNGLRNLVMFHGESLNVLVAIRAYTLVLIVLIDGSLENSISGNNEAQQVATSTRFNQDRGSNLIAAGLVLSCTENTKGSIDLKSKRPVPEDSNSEKTEAGKAGDIQNQDSAYT
ncbi:hypothetical protein BDV98DRAFT_596803 [Pterulicium gracile]|uniref:Uncharacterized protein n=1 Tax=Pterulicium gracile TaxID=1884261 RepID=A0A5C3Q749_9AGAR|nr:hypothetical protein BDV98DRAFT_596803 [Pterula gracilis]